MSQGGERAVAASLGHEEIPGLGVMNDAHPGIEGAAQDGTREDVDWRTLGDDTSVDADDPRQVGGDGVQLVGRHQDRHAGLMKLDEQMKDLVAGLDVDAGGRLIQDQDARTADQRAGEERTSCGDGSEKSDGWAAPITVIP